jgi:predicted extracellular nuclease
MHRAVALLLVAVVVGAGALAVPDARGASTDLVVSQVFAGGGNSGAPYANDFVELFNRGSTAVDVDGWTVQYGSATGTTWQVTALAGSIVPGRHYLVQLASGGTVGAALPVPDATGTSNLAVSGGKVAVVRSTTALACGATTGSCSALSSVADLVGYGAASDYEGGAAAAAIDNTTAATRGSGGCDDTDANGADFASVAAAPRNRRARSSRVASSRRLWAG